MTTIAEVRQQYPQYNDMSDGQLTDALYSKFYSDMPRDTFNQKIGVGGPEYSTSQMVGNYADQALRGVPIVGPLVVKAQDALQSALSGAKYADVSAEGQTRSDRFAKQYPVSSTLAGLAGGTAAMAPLGASAPIVRALGFGGGPLLSNVARGAASGAGIGGVDAALRGENPATGALLGGTFGAGAPLAGRAIGGIASGAINATQKAFAPAETRAAQVAAKTLANDMPVESGAINAKLAQLGPDAMPADLGESMQGLVSTLGAKPETASAIRVPLKARQAKAGDAVEAQFDAVMGPPIDISATEGKIIAQAKKDVRPKYDEFYSTPIQSTTAINDVLNKPWGQAALRKAKIYADNEGQPLGIEPVASSGQGGFQNITAEQIKSMTPAERTAFFQNAFGTTGGSVKVSGVPPATPSGPVSYNVTGRGLDYVKRALDAMHTKAVGKDAKMAGILDGMRKDVLAGVDAQTPKWAEARAIYTDHHEIRDAMKEGLAVFKGGQTTSTPQDVTAYLGTLSAAGKQGYTEGARAAVRNIMGTARNDELAARNIFKTDFNKEKLNLILGPQKAQEVLGMLEARNTFAITHARGTGNSETAARLMGMANLTDAHALPPALHVGIFSSVGGLARLAAVSAVKGVVDALKSGRQNAIEQSLAKLLTAQGVNRPVAIEKIIGVAQKMDKSGKLAGTIQNYLAPVLRGVQPRLGDQRARQ